MDVSTHIPINFTSCTFSCYILREFLVFFPGAKREIFIKSSIVLIWFLSLLYPVCCVLSALLCWALLSAVCSLLPPCCALLCCVNWILSIRLFGRPLLDTLKHLRAVSYINQTEPCRFSKERFRAILRSVFSHFKDLLYTTSVRWYGDSSDNWKIKISALIWRLWFRKYNNTSLSP